VPCSSPHPTPAIPAAIHMVPLIPRLLRAQSVAKLPMAAPTARAGARDRPPWLGSRSGTARWVDPLKDQRSTVDARATGPRNASVSGLGHQETADEHGPPAQPVDDKQRDDVTEPGAAAAELQGRRQLAEREYRLTSRLRQRGHGEVGCSHTLPCMCRRTGRVRGGRSPCRDRRVASTTWSKQRSPYESLWVDSPEALADSAGSASTSI
jgi:hypothetical protein